MCVQFSISSEVSERATAATNGEAHFSFHTFPLRALWPRSFQNKPHTHAKIDKWTSIAKGTGFEVRSNAGEDGGGRGRKGRGVMKALGETSRPKMWTINGPMKRWNERGGRVIHTGHMILGTPVRPPVNNRRLWWQRYDTKQRLSQSCSLSAASLSFSLFLTPKKKTNPSAPRKLYITFLLLFIFLFPVRSFRDVYC